MVVWVGIVVERSLRRTFLRPRLERCQIGEGRQVVASARRHHFFDGAGLREICQQALCRPLVLAERPDTPEIGNERCEAALWQASAALMKVSSVQFSARGGAPAGYIA